MGASTARHELRRSCASTLQVATFLYDVAMFPYDVAMFLYDIATYLHDVLMLRTEGLDWFRGLPSYVRLGRSDHTQKQHRTARSSIGLAACCC